LIPVRQLFVLPVWVSEFHSAIIENKVHGGFDFSWEENMKQSTASKTLLAIVTILTVMMALIVPSPAYAAKEPPPPPPPPSNDTGGQGKPSHSSVKDLPADTTVVVTDNGTPMSLASQLTVDALSAPVSEGVTTNYVKFCKADNTDFNAGDCSSYTSIENAITFVKGLSGDASGVFYVDVNYTASGSAPRPGIALDQSIFSSPAAATDLSLLGGVKFSGTYAGEQGLVPTTLVQPMTISNFNLVSSVSMDLFQFNITKYKTTGLFPPIPDIDSALVVDHSNNVTLTDLTIIESGESGLFKYSGNGIRVSNSNNVSMDTVNVTESNNGAGILIKDSTDVSLENVNVDESGGILDSTSGGIVVSNTNGLDLKTVGVMSDGKGNGITITNSGFLESDITDAVTTSSIPDGAITLDDVNIESAGVKILGVSVGGDALNIQNSGYVFMDKVVTDATGVGAYLKGDTGTLAIDDSQFNDSGYAGLYVSEQNGNTYLKDVQANGNETSTGISLEDLLKTGGAFIDSDSGKVVVRDSQFDNNTGTGLVVHATGGDLFLKDVTANQNTGTGAVLNTLFALDNLQTETGSGKIIVAGDSLDAATQSAGLDPFTSQFNGNGGPGLLAFAGGFAGVFNTEVNGNLNKTNNFLVDIALGLGGVPPLESLLLNPGGAFVYSASPDTVVVGNSNFIGNNGEGLAVMTPGDIRVFDVNGSFNDGMGAFLDNCLLQLSIQCSGQGTISVENSEFDVNSYAGLVALASGAEVSITDDVDGFDQGIYLDQVGASGNQNYGALLLSPADVEVTNSTFNGTVAVSDIEVPISPYQQGIGLDVLSSGNVILGSYEDLFKPDSLFIPAEDFGVLAEGNKNAGGEILGLGSMGGLGGGSLFSNLASDGSSANGVLIGHSKFLENGGDGLTAFATTGIGVSDSIFAGNGGNGLTALSLGDIYLNDSGFFRNKGTGASAMSLLGDIGVDPSIFAGNGGNGLTALALVGNIYLVDSGFYRNGGDGASAISVLGGVVAGGSEFKRNDGNGLTALSLGDILLVDSAFTHNDGTGASAISVLGGVGVGDSVFARNGGNGLTALSLGDIILLDSGFFGNKGTGASVISGLGDIVVDPSIFAGNGGNGLTALSLVGDIYLEDSGFYRNGGDGASIISLLGSIDVEGDNFLKNGENGLTALSLGDIYLTDVFAGANEDNGAFLLSGLGDVMVFSSIFGTPYEYLPTPSKNYGNGENGLVAVTLAGDITLGGDQFVPAATDLGYVDAHQNGMNGIVAATLFGDITANNVYADENNWFGAITIAGGDLSITDSEFDANGTVFPTVTLASVEDFSIGGGLVAIAGHDTTLDTVDASYNHGFGAVVGNFGGLLDLLFSMGSSATGNLSAATGLPDDSFFGSHGDVNIYDSTFNHNDAFGLAVVSGGDVTLDHVQANDNGWFGTYISFGDEANISDSHFSGNGGDGLVVDFNPGLGFFSTDLDENTGSITLDGVIANHNGGDGAILNGVNITISDSKFNSNDYDGLVTFADTLSIYDSQACWNKHKQFVGNGVTINHFGLDTKCKEEVPGGAGPTEQIPLPWQIIKVYTEPGKNGGTLSCQFGTTFLYLEKKTPPTPDFEWARAVLFPCIVPGGSIGTFLGLAEGALPAPLPDGITFQGKAFDLSITGPNGQPIDILGGPMMVRFTLPDGFTLPAGKKLDILWFDPAAKKWVELTTYAGGRYAWGYAGNDGTFVLTIK
jgi:hypothetical protein